MSDSSQIACFVIGNQEYGLDIMQIKEVIHPVSITAVPKALPFIEGIVELRGAILPVVDLRKRFDAPAGPPGRETKYIIVSVEGHIVGLIVDRVREVLRVADEEIRPAPPMAVGPDAGFFTGVYKHGDRMIMLLDVNEVLSAREKTELRSLGGAA